MKKTIISIALVFAMLAAIFPTIAFASSTPVFTADTNWEEVFNPDNFATLDEYDRAARAPFYAVTDMANSGAISMEENGRIVELYYAGRQVFLVRETVSSWAQDAIFSTMDYLPAFTNYQADITRREFVDAVMRWIEHETDIITIWNAIGLPIWSIDAPDTDAGFALTFYHFSQNDRLDAAYRIGFTDGQNMESTLTREQAATMIMRAVNMVNRINEVKAESETGSAMFSFGFEYKVDENNKNIRDKNGNMIFVPRDETIAILNAPIPAPTADFADINQVSNENANGVNFVSANNIMGDAGGNTFDPKGLVTIERAIVSIYNIGRVESIDTASGWAKDGITAAIEKGFVPADLQDTYTNIITRAEFCRMAVKWVEYATGKTIDAVLAENGKTRDPNAFTDVTNSDILAAAALGITSGVGNNRFDPNGQFTRQQAAAMILNTCKVIGADTENPPPSGFSDMHLADGWAHNGINFVRAHGIMSGTGDGFNPKGIYSRQEAIVTFNNIKP